MGGIGKAELNGNRNNNNGPVKKVKKSGGESSHSKWDVITMYAACDSGSTD
jgi:hypothetical protein